VVTNAWKRLRYASRAVGKWMTITQALDLISEAYETKEGIPATAMLTPEGFFLEIELDEVVTELLEPKDIAELCPQAYAMLRRAKAFEIKDTTLTKELK
jgi:hypothetical protein